MKTILALIPALVISMTACRSTSTATGETTLPATHPTGAMPNAVVYQTNGDYADNVPVSLNEEGTALVSYPDPHDISAKSRPIELADGWLLDRRGITPTSAFLSYTYKEYAALPSCPSPEELMSRIIPGSHVTEIRVLPIKLWQAQENPVEASKLVANSPTAYQAR